MDERRSLYYQLLFIYGTGLGFGLHLGLSHLLLRRSLPGALFVVASTLLFGTAIFFLWRSVYPRFSHLSAGRRVLYQALAALFCMSVLSVFVVELYALVLGGSSILRRYDGGPVVITILPEELRRAPLLYALVPIVPTAVICVVGFHLHWRRISVMQSREQELRELASAAQLAALRSQINPHFLFNSLNSIAQLISSDPAKAEACVERLGEILRYLLNRAHRDFVPLVEELEIAEAYLDIERARFGDDLRVTEEIDDAARQVPLPGLVLQPLVENAVKHGISRKIGGGIIAIRAALDNGDLRLSVSDSGAGVEDPERVFERGVGLRNVRDRMLRLYGPDYLPEIVTRAGEGTTVSLRIPIARGTT